MAADPRQEQDPWDAAADVLAEEVVAAGGSPSDTSDDASASPVVQDPVAEPTPPPVASEPPVVAQTAPPAPAQPQAQAPPTPAPPRPQPQGNGQGGGSTATTLQERLAELHREAQALAETQEKQMQLFLAGQEAQLQAERLKLASQRVAAQMASAFEQRVIDEALGNPVAPANPGTTAPPASPPDGIAGNPPVDPATQVMSTAPPAMPTTVQELRELIDARVDERVAPLEDWARGLRFGTYKPGSQAAPSKFSWAKPGRRPPLQG